MHVHVSIISDIATEEDSIKASFCGCGQFQSIDRDRTENQRFQTTDQDSMDFTEMTLLSFYVCIEACKLFDVIPQRLGFEHCSPI